MVQFTRAERGTYTDVQLKSFIKRFEDHLQSDFSGSNYFLIPIERVLGNPAQIVGIVHIDEAKTLVITIAPFEVVHKTPMVVTLHRDAILHGLFQFHQIPAGVVNSLRIMDFPI